MLDLINTNPKLRELIVDTKTIKAYQNKLAESDYKIIKCYEYSLAGLDLPYDVIELHNERELIRKEIRKLENKIKE